MSHHSSVAVFAFDAPVNQTPAHKIPAQTSQLRTMGKMVTGTPLIYGPALLLLLAACANGNNVNLDNSPQDETEQPEDETQDGTQQPEEEPQEPEDEPQGGTQQPEEEPQDGTITGTDEDDDLIVVPRDHVVRGLGGSDDISGGTGNDVIYAGPGGNRIDGEDGDDIIHASLGVNVIDGGAGFDTVDYSDATKSVYLFLDDHQYLGSTYGNLLIDEQDERFEEGGEFGPNDDVYNIESVILSDFDDQVSADGFATVFDGGAGSDTRVFADSIEAITIDWCGGVDADGYYVMASSLSPGEWSDAFERGTKFKNFERIAGSPEDDTFYGADDADFFFLAGDGDDTLISGKGSDTFHAGHWREGGFDVVDYSRAEGGIRVDLNDLDDDNFATITIDHADWKDDKVKYVEDVIGSNHDDTFSGEVDVTNYFTGGDGRDVFYTDDWEHSWGDEYNFDVVTDFVVGTDKIGFWVDSANLDIHFSVQLHTVNYSIIRSIFRFLNLTRQL